MTQEEILMDGNFDYTAQLTRDAEPVETVQIKIEDAVYLRFICKEFAKTLIDGELKSLCDAYVLSLEGKITDANWGTGAVVCP